MEKVKREMTKDAMMMGRREGDSGRRTRKSRKTKGSDS